MKEENNSQFSILNTPLIPPGYKQTEVGVIPEDWDVLPVSKLGETKRGAGSLCIKYRSSGGVRLIRINDFFQDNPVFVEPTDEIMRYSIHERDLLFAGTGASAGASYLPKQEWIGLPHSYNAPRIRVFEKSCKEYLLYSLQTDYVLKQQRAWFVGNAQPFLDTKAISNFSISLPPTKAEQEAIAGALSDADALIESLEQLLTKKRHLKQGAMQKLLTGKTRLPGFSGEWEIKTLGEIGEALIGLTYTPNDVRADGVLVLRSSNVFEGNLRFDDNVYVQLEISERIMIRSGDILICVRNGSRDLIGKCAKIDERCEGMTFGAFMAVFRTPFYGFVFYQFQSNVLKRQIHEHLGATINQITNKSLNSFSIPFPKDEAEQTAIAAILSDMDAEIAALEAKLAKTRQIKQGMMQALLTGKIRLIN
jgi:type I restriction enzyme, S subunit